MVTSCTRLEQPSSASNLGDATAAPSSRRLGCEIDQRPRKWLSSQAQPLGFAARHAPEMHAVERSRLHRPPQVRRKVASTVRNVTVQLELSQRMCPRVAAGCQLGLRIQRRSSGSSDRK